MTKLSELDNACKKKKKDSFYSLTVNFHLLKRTPLGIAINIKVSETHLCSVLDQFVTQRNGITKYYLEQICTKR